MKKHEKRFSITLKIIFQAMKTIMHQINREDSSKFIKKT